MAYKRREKKQPKTPEEVAMEIHNKTSKLPGGRPRKEDEKEKEEE